MKHLARSCAVIVVLAAFLLAMSGCSTKGASSASLGPGMTDGGPHADGSAQDATSSLTSGDAATQGLTIQPQNQTITSMGAGATVQFTATTAGSSTLGSVAWSVTSGVLIGSISTSGLFTTSGIAGGTVNIQAQVGTLTAQTQLHVVLDVVDNPGNVATSVQQTLEAGADAGAADGGVDPGFIWLYPYNSTVFPRGLLPPTLQFGGVAPDATYVHVSFGSLDYKGFFGPSSPGQVALSPAAWTTITETAGAGDSVQVQITKISGGQVAGPITESWTIAQGTLKGTVYYESRYSSPNDDGATMRIRPGAPQPDVLLGGCTVCHYASGDGSTLVAEADPSGARTSAAYNLTTDAGIISQKPDETYALGALNHDGSLVMSGGLGGVYGFDGVVPSQLFNVKTGAQVPATGWDGVVTKAVLPSFSPDGTQIVFNHFDNGQGHSLALMSFNAATTTFSGLVDIASDPVNFLGWPSFTPGNEWVIYDSDSQEFITCSPACGGVGTANPTADLMIAHVGSKTTAALDSLNGKANGQYYLPFGEQAEGHMNYQPSVLPISVGGYYWVVFTSRREYGNMINTPDPYYCTDNRTAGALPWRKKLWVAALDVDPTEQPSTSAHDISHPAFYLDGQDLQTGNYRGFWALSPCQAMGAGCQDGDECCSGFCRQVTGDAGTSDGGAQLVCVPPQACANEFEKCTTASDCCMATPPLQCIGGYCAQVAQ